MLLVLNLPLIGMWVKILKAPYPILAPIILLFCVIGAYSINNNPVDVYTMIACGMVGYFFKKINNEAAPLIIAMVLSKMLENSLRQSLLLSHSNFSIFVTRPISLVLLIIAFILLTYPLLPLARMRKKIETLESD